MPECPFFRSKSQVSKGNLVHNSNSTTLNSDFQIPAQENWPFPSLPSKRLVKKKEKENGQVLLLLGQLCVGHLFSIHKTPSHFV
ncbi:Uncharacterized protein APZ42_021795 [Daphnia magna]|uniref:Uncharacterized protein n=1 Tax=Daphnia magna TaxID=35525 RepID=A0A164WCE8_9CRUS|nr:Uncharacterized protein APZ42_021795 [Daphnia magna]